MNLPVVGSSALLAVLWLLVLQIRRGRRVKAQELTVNINSRTSNCLYNLLPKKNPIIQIFCLSGRLAVPMIQISGVLPKGARCWWRSWLRHCVTSRKVAGSISDGVTGIFHWYNPSGRTMALGPTQPLTEMSTKNNSWGIKSAGA
jgi:hypothetical protein